MYPDICFSAVLSNVFSQLESLLFLTLKSILMQKRLS